MFERYLMDEKQVLDNACEVFDKSPVRIIPSSDNSTQLRKMCKLTWLVVETLTIYSFIFNNLGFIKLD